MIDTIVPAFRSVALERIPERDHLSVLFQPLPDGAPTDPEAWGRAVFALGRAPGWVRALFALRQQLVGLIGLERSTRSVLDVTEVVGEEAIVAAQDRHLDFVAGIGVDTEQRLVRLTTTVRLKGWRGRLYFAPVRVLHGPVTRALLRRAAARLTPAS